MIGKADYRRQLVGNQSGRCVAGYLYASCGVQESTTDVVFGGQSIRAGDKVTHWYPSANRDERVFAEPFRFDVGRDPNPHLAFGHGVHHCLGASLARSEIAIVLEEMLARDLAIELAGPVEWTRSNKHTGIRSLPVRLR